MTTLVILIVIAFLIHAVAYVVVFLSAFGAADKMFDEVTAIYESSHEYRSANPAHFSSVPGDGYEKVRGELSRLGFQYVGSLENLTMSEAYPGLRTFMATYISDSGDVYAATYRTLDAEFGQQVIDFETVFQDDTFLITTNARLAGLTQLPSSIERSALSDVHEADSLLKAHSHRLTELRSVKIPRRIRSLDDLIGAQRLFSELECQYRRDVGYLTFEEAKAMSERTQGRSFLPGSVRFFHWVFMRRVQKHKSGMVVV